MRATMPPTARLMQAWLLFLMLSACGGPRVPALPHLAPDATILAFGDSLTYGTGTSAKEAYPAQLQEITGRRVINAGIPGETTAGGLERLAAELDDSKPDLVILCLGGNDMLRRLDAQQMHDNLARMIEEIKRRGIPLILLAVPRPSLFDMKPDPGYAALASQYRLPIESGILATLEADRSKKSDAIHPNAKGYREMAEAIAALMHKAGAI